MLDNLPDPILVNCDDLEKRIDFVYEHIIKHPNQDPNASEMVELFVHCNEMKRRYHLYGNLADELSSNSIEKLNFIWAYRSHNFEKNKLGKDNLAYQICNDAFHNQVSKEILNKSTLIALSKMAAIDLWLNQSRRDNVEVKVNPVEIEEIIEHIELSNLAGVNINHYYQIFNIKKETSFKKEVKQVYQYRFLNDERTSLDPNAYQLVGLLAKRHLNEIDEDTDKKLTMIWKNQKINFVRNNIGINNISYQICHSLHEKQFPKNLAESDIEALQMMAGINLWISQEIRDKGEANYNNTDEWIRLRDLIKNTSHEVINDCYYEFAADLNDRGLGKKRQK